MATSQWIKTYFLIRFYSNALRPPKTQNFVHREERHAFRWRLSATSPPKTHQTEGPSQQEGFLCPAQQSLQGLRGHPGAGLSYCSWIWQDRDNASSPAQRCLSVSDRIARLSRSTNPSSLSFENGASCPAQIKTPSRQAILGNDAETLSAYTHHFRHGLNGPRTVRQAGNGQYRIQPKETRAAIIPSSRLFQRHYQRLLARRTPTRRCSYCCRRSRFSEGVFYKSASISKSHNHQSRQGFFRSQDNRIPGVRECSVRYRCQIDASNHRENLQGYRITDIHPASRLPSSSIL